MRFAVGLGLPIFVLFAALAAREWLLEEPAPSRPETEAIAVEPPPVPDEPEVVVASAEQPAPAVPAPAPAAALADDAPSVIVPADLATPLRAVASEVKLCIPESLERDRGPLDVEVHFTP